MMNLFKSKRQLSAEREQRLRAGQIRIGSNIKREEAIADKVLKLAKRALALGDDAQFKQLGRRYVMLLDDINKKRRYVVSLEALSAQIDQGHAAVEFMEAMRDVVGSVTGIGDPANLAIMQRQAEEGLSSAQSMSDRLDAMMDLAATNLTSPEFDDARLQELEQSLARGAPARADGEGDPLESALDKLAKAMKRT